MQRDFLHKVLYGKSCWSLMSNIYWSFLLRFSLFTKPKHSFHVETDFHQGSMCQSRCGAFHSQIISYTFVKSPLFSIKIHQNSLKVPFLLKKSRTLFWRSELLLESRRWSLVVVRVLAQSKLLSRARRVPALCNSAQNVSRGVVVSSCFDKHIFPCSWKIAF